MKFLEENERTAILAGMHSKQGSRIYKLLHAIILYDDGLSIAKITRFFYLGEEKIRTYIESFRNNEIPGSKIFRYKGKEAHLDKDQLAELKLHVSSKVYLNAEGICDYVLVKYKTFYKP
jgi:transposase